MTHGTCSRDQGVSGAKAQRPGLDKCLDSLREGDTLIVLDRLGRSLAHLIGLVNELGERGDKFKAYGLQLTRIVTITRTHVDAATRPVKLTIGADPIELPETLGEAVTQPLESFRTRSNIWLFPGRNLGRPLTPGPLSLRLRR